MSLIDLIAEKGGRSAIDQIGARVGLSPEQTRSAMAALIPSLASGFRRRASAGGLEGPLAAAPVDDVATDTAVSQGNDILDQIFGSKDVSRSVAADASEKTGIGADQLKGLLPMLAALAAGAMSSKVSAQPGGMDGLLGMLDRDGDGSPLNDVMGMAGKFFGR